MGALFSVTMVRGHRHQSVRFYFTRAALSEREERPSPVRPCWAHSYVPSRHSAVPGTHSHGLLYLMCLLLVHVLVMGWGAGRFSSFCAIPPLPVA